MGATENIMMAAVLAQGTTIIRNAAREPEIIDLQNFLNKLGARVKGAGLDVIRIDGVPKIGREITYRVIPDRIETGTFMVAAAVTRGDVLIRNTIPEHMEPVTAKLRETGVEIREQDDWIHVRGVDHWGILGYSHHAISRLPYRYAGPDDGLSQPGPGHQYHHGKYI